MDIAGIYSLYQKNLRFAIRCFASILLKSCCAITMIIIRHNVNALRILQRTICVEQSVVPIIIFKYHIKFLHQVTALKNGVDEMLDVLYEDTKAQE